MALDPLQYRRRQCSIKLETTEGTDPGGTYTALLIGDDAAFQFATENVQRNRLRDTFGSFGKIITKETFTETFTLEMSARGTVGGAVPPCGIALRAAGHSEVIRNTDLTGTAQGGTTTSVTLAASASAVDNFYLGEPIQVGSQIGMITAYNGTTKVATVSIAWTSAPTNATPYSILANVRYLPVTDGPESFSLRYNIDGKQFQFLGARGTVQADLNVSQIPLFNFTVTGRVGPVTDNPIVVADFSGWQPPLPVATAYTRSLNIQGFRDATAEQISINTNQQITHKVGIGRDSVTLTGRQASGTLTVEETSVADWNWLPLMRQAATGPFSFIHGDGIGRYVGFVAPAMSLSNPRHADSDGTATVQFDTDFQTVGAGNNETIWTFF